MKRIFLNRRTARLAGAAALVLAALASMVAGRENPVAEVIQATSARPPAGAVVPPPSDIDLARLERTAPAPAGNDPFAPKSFAPPPQAPVARASAPPQPPSAPPLPFVYAGKVTQDGKTDVYVTRDDNLISIAPGESIDAEYRVDAVTASSIRFTYLPLKTLQSLELGEAGG
jgi:hypothetical protein